MPLIVVLLMREYDIVQSSSFYLLMDMGVPMVNAKAEKKLLLVQLVAHNLACTTLQKYWGEYDGSFILSALLWEKVFRIIVLGLPKRY